MNYSPADVIRKLLVDANLVLAQDDGNNNWPAYVSAIPLDPDQVVILYDEKGMPDGRLMRGGVVIEHPGVQIVARALDPPVAYDKAVQLSKYTDEQVNRIVVTMPDEITQYRVVNISRRSPILPLKEEDIKRRVRYLYNTNVTLEGPL